MKPELKLVDNTGSDLIEPLIDPLSELPPQQSEMPFAMVEGEPITEMPRDLYIPPDALQVCLEAFEGPLDLLLYLIRRQNLDVLDIPIAEITRQYMKYIEVMHELQLELAGEYLLMAAMLAEIKSRMLLPRVKSEDGLEEVDPRAELVRRLQEYERFKKAAADLDHLPRMERDTLSASAELSERKIVRLVPQVTLQEMLLAFRDVVVRSNMFAHHHVQRERLSVRQRMSDILGALKQNAWVEFANLFRAEEGRMGVSVTFSAILELMREGLIEIIQAEVYGPLHVRPASGGQHLSLVSNTPAVPETINEEALAEQADAENIAALSQPAQPDEDQDWEPEDDIADTDDAAHDETQNAGAGGAPPEVQSAGEAEIANEGATTGSEFESESGPESHADDSMTDASASATISTDDSVVEIQADKQDS